MITGGVLNDNLFEASELSSEASKRLSFETPPVISNPGTDNSSIQSQVPVSSPVRKSVHVSSPVKKTVEFSDQAKVTHVRSDRPVKEVFSPRKSGRVRAKTSRLIEECGVKVNFDPG